MNNEIPETLIKASEEIFNYISKKLNIIYTRATITRLHKRDYLALDLDNRIPYSEYVRSVIYSHIKNDKDTEFICPSTHSIFHRPIKDDYLMQQVLSGGKDSVYICQDIQKSPPNYWHTEASSEIKSWIAMPLWDANEPFALLTLDFEDKPIEITEIQMYESQLKQSSNRIGQRLRQAASTELRQKLHKALETIAQQNKADAQATLDAVARETCKLVDGLFAYVVRPETLDEKITRLTEDSAETSETPETLAKKIACSTEDNTDRFMFLSAEPPSLLGKLKLKAPLSLLEQEEAEEEKGITVQAFTKGKHFIVDDCKGVFHGQLEHNRNLYFDFEPEEGVKSGSNLTVPIVANVHIAADAHHQEGRIEKQILGVINVEHLVPCRFSEEEISAVKEFADHAAIALKTLIDKEYLNGLYTLSNTTQSISEQIRSAQLDKDDFLEEIMRYFANKTCIAADATRGVKIFIKHDNTFRLVGESSDIQKRGKTALPRREQGHSWWCIDKQEPVVIPDTDRYRKIAEGIMTGEILYTVDGALIKVNPDTRDSCVVGLPMCHSHDSAPLGVVWLHYKRPTLISEEEIKVLQTFANGLAVILFNLREYRLLRFAERISGYSPTYEFRHELANDICRYIARRFNVDGAVYYALDKDESNLKRLGTNVVRDDYGEWSPYRDTANSEPVDMGQGLVGRLFAEIDDSRTYNASTAQKEHHLEYDFERNMVYAPNYKKYANFLKAKNVYVKMDTSISYHPFRSVLAVIMRAGGTNEKVGVLLISHEPGRKYGDDTRKELHRIGQLTSSLIVSAEFFKNDLSAGQRVIIYLLALILGILTLLPELVTDGTIPLWARIIIIIVVSIGSAYVIFPEVQRRLEKRFKKR